MSFDSIQLPAIVIQELFKNSLIELDIEQKVQQNTNENSFSTLGNNRKQILILVSNEEAAFLPDNQLNFLLGILSACKLSMDDVAVLNMNKNKNATYQTLKEAISYNTMLLFDVSPASLSLPLDFPQYQVQSYNKQTYLQAPSLPAIEADKAEKAKLWNCLKNIFNI